MDTLENNENADINIDNKEIEEPISPPSIIEDKTNVNENNSDNDNERDNEPKTKIHINMQENSLKSKKTQICIKYLIFHVLRCVTLGHILRS